MRLYLNPKVIFKSKPTFSCVYNNHTGWYYQSSKDFWKTLQSYKRGRDVDEGILPQALSELVQNLFLIKTRRLNPEELYKFHPMRVPGTVYFQHRETIDVAIERKGAHGEIDFDVISLDGEIAELWRLCDGVKRLEEITRELNIDALKALREIGKWVAIENQLARLLFYPISKIQTARPQLVYKAPFLPQKALAKPWASDVHRYHIDAIKDGAEQFDRIESTLSHLYRVPHPILNGQSYGQALFSKINEEKTIKNGMRILEIGGGAGNISADMLEKIKQARMSIDYIIYDLSPSLIKAQRKLHVERGIKALHINGNAEVLTLKDKCIDIAFSNEAIADFYTPEVERSHVRAFLMEHKIPATEEFFQPYENAPESIRVNLGAYQMLKELFRVLRPDGLAVLSEFGFQDRLPFRAGHLDHAEYSIHFGQLKSVAAALGFKVYLTDAFDFLSFKKDTRLITGFSYQAAFRLMERQGIYLPNITYTEDLLKKQLKEKAEGFRGLRYVEPILDPFRIVKFIIMSKQGQVDNI